MAGEVAIRLRVDGAGRARAEVDGVSDSLVHVGAGAKSATTGSERLADALGRVGRYGIAGGSLYGVVQTVSAASRALFEASANAQRLSTQLNFASGGNGVREMAFVLQLANRLGLEINSTAKAYAGFASAARGTAIEGRQARQVFESISMASAVMGLTADETSGALLAVQQMLSKGVVSAEEFRGQLGERMPIALRAGAAALNVTEAEFSKLLETGQIVAADFLPKFGEAIRREVGDAANEAANRLDASTARMGNAWTRLKQVIGDSGVSQALGGAAGMLANDMTAITEAMDRAKASGGGFFAQMNAGLGQFIGRALGLQFMNREFLTLQQAASDAAATIKRLDEQESRDGKLGFYSMQRRAEAVRDLAKATRELAAANQLNSGAGQGRGSVIPETIGAAAAREAKALADLNTLQLKLAKVPESYLKDMQEVIRLNQAGVLVGKKYTDMLAVMQAQLSKNTTAGSAENKALAERIALMQQIYGGADGRAAAREAFRRSEIDATEAVNAKLLADAMAAAAKATDDARKAHADLIRDLEASADSVGKQVQRLQDEEAAAGIAAAQNISLAQAIELVTIARLQEQQAIQMSYGNDQAADAIQREIDKRRELGGLIAGKETRDASAKAADQAADDWKRASDQIGSSLTDALLRGFESGKGFAENLRDTVVNMFKTMVLRPVIQAVVTPIAGSITSAMGFAGTANAAGSAGSALGSAGNLASMAGMAGSLGSFGTAAGYGLSAAFGGTAGTAISSGASMIGAGSFAEGAGMMIGAAGPYVLAAIAAYYAVKSLTADKNAKLGYGSTTGDRAFGFGRGTDVGSQAQLADIAKAVQGGISGTAAALGGSAAGIDIQTATDIDRKGKGSAIFGILRGGSLVSGVQTGASNPLAAAASKMDAGQLSEWFAANASAAIIAGLQQSELPTRMREFFGGVNAFGLTKEQADAMLATASAVQAVTVALRPLGGVFGQLEGLSVAAVESLAKVSGGVDALQQKAGAYAANFYSAAEQQAAAWGGINRTLGEVGLAVPATREAFRGLVDSLNLGTVAGQQQFAALMNVSAAFAELVPATGALAAASRSAADIASERAGLERSLLELQGDTTELRRRELAALDGSNRALQQRIYDLTDEQAASKAAAEASQKLRDAWSSVGDTIAAEIARIRGSSSGAAQSLGGAQAGFAIATAQARAGDQVAAASLPELSRVMLDLAGAQATTSQQLAIARGAAAASLSQTEAIIRALAEGKPIPAFADGGWHAGGLRIVGERGPELEAVGPARYWSAAQTAGMAAGSSQDQRELIAEIRQLRDDLRAGHGAIATSSARAAALLDRFERDGLVVRTDADAPLSTVAA